MQVADGAHAFEKRRDMQDRRFRQPAADDLDVDGQAFPARAEAHRNAGQASDVERHGRSLEIGGVDLLAVDDELLLAVLVPSKADLGAAGGGYADERNESPIRSKASTPAPAIAATPRAPPV